jgi:hypothetical protein
MTNFLRKSAICLLFARPPFRVAHAVFLHHRGEFLIEVDAEGVGQADEDEESVGDFLAGVAGIFAGLRASCRRGGA